MPTLSLPTKMVKAALHIAAKRDVRYYIQSVHISKDGHIVSTNGTALFWTSKGQAKVVDSATNAIPATGWTIPAEFLKRAVKGVRADQLYIQISEDALENYRVELTFISNGVIAKSEPMHFPDWRRVIPSTQPIHTTPAQVNDRDYGGINLDVLAAIWKANSVFTSKDNSTYPEIYRFPCGKQVFKMYHEEAQIVAMPYVLPKERTPYSTYP